MCREIVRERHSVIALGIVRAKEQSDFARRYKIRQVLDCGVIGAEFLEVSLVKLAPPVRVMAKPSPECGARGDVLQPHVDAGMLLREPARPDAVDVHPPALTKAVQKLEQELGGALIHRERHLTQLTELGKMILPTLEKIFAAAEAVRLQARGYQKKTIAPLKIGLVPSVSAALIRELLLEVARIIPDLRVDLREADANGLIAMLLDGEINAALVGDAVWSYPSVSIAGGCSRSGTCSSCL